MILLLKKYRFVLAALGFAAAIMLVIFTLFSIDNSTNKMIVEYLEGIGWEVEDSPVEIAHLTLPERFDTVYETYNAVQTESGYDMSPFKGKSVSRYSYRVINHKRSASVEVVANIFVYENRIIAGDISSTAPNGFMHGLNETENILKTAADGN